MFGLDLGNGQAEMNLDNETDTHAESAPCEERGESSMASKFRGSYTYIDETVPNSTSVSMLHPKKKPIKSFSFFWQEKRHKNNLCKR